MNESISTDERNPVEIIEDLLRRDVVKPQYRKETTQTKRFGLTIGRYQASAWIWSYRGYDYALIRNPGEPQLIDLSVRREDENSLGAEYPEHVRDLLNYVEERASPCGRVRDIFSDRHPYTNPNDPGRTRSPDNPLRPFFGVMFYMVLTAATFTVMVFVESDAQVWVLFACALASIISVMISISRLVTSIRAIPSRGKKMVNAVEWTANIVNPIKRFKG